MFVLFLCALALDSGAVERRVLVAPGETLTVTISMSAATDSAAAAPALPAVFIPG